MAESANNEAFVELSFGLKSHTVTTAAAGDNVCVINLNDDLTVIHLGKTLAGSVRTAEEVHISRVGRVFGEKVELVEEVVGVVRVFEVPLGGGGVAGQGQSGGAQGNNRRCHDD